MRLYNAVAIYDIWVVADSPEAARETVKSWIQDKPEDESNKPNELTCTETAREATIRASWREQKPLVGSDISDEDFETLKGKTTIDIWKKIYTKNG